MRAGDYDARARLLCWRPAPPDGGRVAVVTAGTADGPVADEAAAVARATGLQVAEFRDVGVAGLHRLLAVAGDLAAADVVIVIAGMEGALASAVAGLVGVPVVAVPTSTGYGAALDGVTALLAMMTSCAAGVCVVNIDSGFGAPWPPTGWRSACAAGPWPSGRTNQLRRRARRGARDPLAEPVLGDLR